MAENWESNEWEPKQKEQKTVYSQSFSRGGGRNYGDRNSGGNYRQNRQDDGRNESNRGYRNSEGYGRNQNDSFKSDNFNRGNNQDASNSKIIHVDTRNIGRIIGRGGSKVKQLEQESGARININKNRSDTTEVTLIGTEDNISRAEQMINEAISDNASGFSRPYEREGNSRPHERENFYKSQENGNSSRSYDRNDTSHQYNSRYSQSSDYHSNYASNQPNYSQKNQQTVYSSYQSPPLPEPQAEDRDEVIDWNAVYKESEIKAAAYLASLPPIVKQLYVEDEEVANMTVLEVAEWRLKNMNITVSRVFAETDEENLPIPNPVKTFEQAFRPYPDILKTIRDQGFETPSPIQSQAWPVLMSGEDLIGIAQTGTGKTLAFLLPAMIHIEAQKTPRPERVGPSVLILSPTRELALQIEKEINKYSYRDIKCVCVYGGVDRRQQIRWLNNDKPEIVVACPGRLDDLVMAAEVKLDSVTYVVLDEADKMLEMGFECQIRKILINIRSDRQTVMTSATWPSDVRRLATQYSVNPVQVVVGSLDLTAVHSVSQRIEIIDEEKKRERLDEFLREMGDDDKVIVFCGKKSVTDDIASDLVLKGIQCQSLHGDREQCDREQALQDLKTGEVRILIATDVAARGLDIVDITHIFNYDFPKNIEEYVHRIGRTGRAGRTGESISLFTRRDWANAADLIKILEEADQGVPEELFKMAERFEARKKRDDAFGGRGRRGGGGRGGGGRGGGGRGRW